MSLKNTYIITPSWLMKSEKSFSAGLKTLKNLGFGIANPAFPEKLPSDKAKAEEIHRAFRDKKINFILAQRGGSSSLRILPYIDYALIKKNKKMFAGFSDLSTLLNSIYERTGLVTLHAPMVISLEKPSKLTIRSFVNAAYGFPKKELLYSSPVKVFKSGRAEGILKGGNLMTLSSLFGTKWELKTENCILFLEEVDEKLYEVDRYLSQWIIAGKFKNIKGLLLGNFKGIKPAEVYKIISSQLKIKFPVMYCGNIGHVKNKLTLPVGAKAELDTARGALTLK
ncbi:MAG: LD-carboxypeptidase [Candidatus Firestonebacteria bacterium]